MDTVAFSNLYKLYVKAVGQIESRTKALTKVSTIFTEKELYDLGEDGVYLMLAQLYRDPPSGAAAVFSPDSLVKPGSGLTEEVQKMASALLRRQVGPYDMQLVFRMTAERHELSPEAFDRVHELIKSNPMSGNNKIKELLARPSKFTTINKRKP